MDPPTPEPESPLQFPCTFPIKVMGRNDAEFEPLVLELVGRHAGPIAPANVSRRASTNGSYLSVTVTIFAESREQLDAIYRSLTSTEQVLFVL